MDNLELKIELLKKSLAATWSSLAKSSSSADDKCQMRAQAKRCSQELRRCLLIAEAKQTRKHAKATDTCASAAKGEASALRPIKAETPQWIGAAPW
ncbi:hypothetical protein ACRQ5Q_27810 [Bradyrhizobium sp. PMVTL-01]|uniref:hypothetical protein n=1 Tax=Bradyrhizobium sp. PMVTL-01 TaxID=3434999 RepID=UPI003F70CDFD